MKRIDTLEDINEVNDELYEFITSKQYRFTPNGLVHILAYQLASLVIYNLEDGFDSREISQKIVADIHDDIIKQREEEAKEGKKNADKDN